MTYGGLEYLVALGAQGVFFRAEDHSNTVTARLWQRQAQVFAFRFEKLMRELKEYSGPVSGYIVCAGCAAVMKIYYRLFAVVDNRMVARAVYIYYRTDAAGIVLKPRFI
jgi:hypothetical protein